jgi:hypothetical protein
MESLVRQTASSKGMSIQKLLRKSLMPLAQMRGLSAEKVSLRERLAALAKEVDAIPLRHDEILNYNEQGT